MSKASFKSNLNRNKYGNICGMTGKKVFKSEEMASDFGINFIRNHKPSDTDKFRAYNCEYCGFWHLTKKI